MKRLIRILSIAALCISMASPQLYARGRNNNNNNNNNGGSRSRHTTTTPHRDNRHAQPLRPSTPDRNETHSRGRSQQQHQRVNEDRRPTMNKGSQHKDNKHGNKHGDRRPGHGNNFGPGNPHGNHRPGHDFGHRPPRPNHRREVPHHAPHRPMLPPPPPNFRPPVPPPPPPHFRPAPRAPRFSTILGIALGTAINMTLDNLLNAGYYVTGYTNNAIYVNDAMMLNMMWPNTTLYYNDGRLYGSEFVYSAPYYDSDRYYSTFNALRRNYGAPVQQTVLPGGGMQANWYGFDGRYVTLTFNSGIAMDGQIRYYTTLSFGN